MDLLTVKTRGIQSDDCVSKVNGSVISNSDVHDSLFQVRSSLYTKVFCPLRASRNEFVGTPMEEPLDSFHEYNMTSLFQVTT